MSLARKMVKWREAMFGSGKWSLDSPISNRLMRPKWRVVDCNGDNPPHIIKPGTTLPADKRLKMLGDNKVEFFTWEEAVIYVNDHSLHIIELK